jgi:hypothetical protein
VGPRAGLDDVEKRKFLTLPGFELRSLCCSARSQSLYRLRYPGSLRYLIYYGKANLNVNHFISYLVKLKHPYTEGPATVSSDSTATQVLSATFMG